VVGGVERMIVTHSCRRWYSSPSAV
jgi:hypothetical protein